MMKSTNAPSVQAINTTDNTAAIAARRSKVQANQHRVKYQSPFDTARTVQPARTPSVPVPHKTVEWINTYKGKSYTNKSYLTDANGNHIIQVIPNLLNTKVTPLDRSRLKKIYSNFGACSIVYDTNKITTNYKALKTKVTQVPELKTGRWFMDYHGNVKARKVDGSVITLKSYKYLESKRQREMAGLKEKALEQTTQDLFFDYSEGVRYGFSHFVIMIDSSDMSSDVTDSGNNKLTQFGDGGYYSASRFSTKQSMLLFRFMDGAVNIKSVGIYDQQSGNYMRVSRTHTMDTLLSDITAMVMEDKHVDYSLVIDEFDERNIDGQHDELTLTLARLMDITPPAHQMLSTSSNGVTNHYLRYYGLTSDYEYMRDRVNDYIDSGIITSKTIELAVAQLAYKDSAQAPGLIFNEQITEDATEYYAAADERVIYRSKYMGSVEVRVNLVDPLKAKHILNKYHRDVMPNGIINLCDDLHNKDSVSIHLLKEQTVDYLENHSVDMQIDKMIFDESPAVRHTVRSTKYQSVFGSTPTFARQGLADTTVIAAKDTVESMIERKPMDPTVIAVDTPLNVARPLMSLPDEVSGGSTVTLMTLKRTTFEAYVPPFRKDFDDLDQVLIGESIGNVVSYKDTRFLITSIRK